MGQPDGDANLRRPHPLRLDPRRPDYLAILGRHDEALAAGEAGYTDPTTGLFVLSAGYLLARGYCCDQGCRHCPFLPREGGHDDAVVMTKEQAIRLAHEWFEVNSGWAPPDPDTLEEWVADGVCRCPDECLVVPDGWCRHGLASWKLILAALDDG